MKDLKDFKTLEQQVEAILWDYPTTRQDDMFLYYVYCRKKVAKLDSKEFLHLFVVKAARTEHKIKSYGSVSRARRKIQAKKPELKDLTTTKTRKEQENIYRKYAIS